MSDWYPCFLLVTSFVLNQPIWAQETTNRGSELHVATGGDDRWSGVRSEPNANRTDGPLATLEGARDRLRQLRRNGEIGDRPVTIWIQGGTYELSRPLELTKEDSGSSTAPVVYRAMPGEQVRLLGGRVLNGWQPVTDADVLRRLDATARGQVQETQLPADVVKQLTPIQPGSTSDA